MTEVSNMVTYYNAQQLMYRQQQASVGQQQQSSLSNHQPPASPASLSPNQNTTQQQQSVVAAATEAGQHQQHGSWYPNYGPMHHPPQHHHGGAAASQQYLPDHEVPTIWSQHHSYLQYQHQHAQAYHQQQQMQQQLMQSQIDWSDNEGSTTNNNSAAGSSLNSSGVDAGEPSPPITVSGSEISSPGTPASPSAGSNNNNSITAANNNNTPPQRQNRSPYEWMKKSAYQPNPGKTRTKEKYRVVYTEHQRLELEKEFYSSKYITIRRKAELAATLALSERQVKIWFQNRRAKDRKQCKKRGDIIEPRDIKPILDAHGVAHPATHAPPVSGMAGLSLSGMSMNMLGGLIHNNGTPTPLSHHLNHHHHHHQAAHHALLAATAGHHTHSSQHSVIGM